MAEFVTLTYRPTEIEAKMLASFLEAQGIPCFLSGNRVTSVVGPVTELTTSWSNPLGGVEIQVASTALEEARALLQSIEPEHDEKLAPKKTENLWHVARPALVGILAHLFASALKYVGVDWGIWSYAIGLALFISLMHLLSKRYP